VCTVFLPEIFEFRRNPVSEESDVSTSIDRGGVRLGRLGWVVVVLRDQPEEQRSFDRRESGFNRERIVAVFEQLVGPREQSARFPKLDEISTRDV